MTFFEDTIDDDVHKKFGAKISKEVCQLNFVEEGKKKKLYKNQYPS
jgi:hypothetical protein